MKTVFLEVVKNVIFPQFFKYRLNDINVSLAWVVNVDEDLIKVNNDKNIEFFGQDLVNMAQEASRWVGKPKKHYLILEVVVLSLKSRLTFIFLFYPHPMVSTCEVKLGESFCLN